MSGLPAGVAAIAAAVASGEVDAAEITADHLSRAEASQGTLNAFTSLAHETALTAATKIDTKVAAGELVGPLAGVPIAIKDLIDDAGRPNTAGSSLETPPPTVSAPVVSRLEAAGAIIIGRTGLHEYAFGFSSENHWFGPVRNPWDPKLSPGGSSGGSAAAVSAGVAAASLGTDTGGSVRVPAALCGIVGLKGSHGRVPLTGVFPLAPSLDTVGPLARDVTDTGLIYLAIAGYDATDPWSAPQPVLSARGPAAISDLTIGIPHPWVDYPQTDAVSAAFAATIEALRDAGVSVIDLDMPTLVPGPEIEDSAYPEVALIHDERWHAHADTYGPDVSHRLREVFDLDPMVYVAAQQWRARIRHTAAAALNECDVLMTPSVAANVKPVGEEMIEVAGKAVSYRGPLSRFSALVNHTGLPAIALPLDSDGAPPPSVQLIGRQWDEHRLLEVGLTFEQLGISGYRRPGASTGHSPQSIADNVQKRA